MLTALLTVGGIGCLIAGNYALILFIVQRTARKGEQLDDAAVAFMIMFFAGIVLVWMGGYFA